LNRFW
jgi:hypothetical protein